MSSPSRAIGKLERQVTPEELRLAFNLDENGGSRAGSPKPVDSPAPWAGGNQAGGNSPQVELIHSYGEQDVRKMLIQIRAFLRDKNQTRSLRPWAEREPFEDLFTASNQDLEEVVHFVLGVATGLSEEPKQETDVKGKSVAVADGVAVADDDANAEYNRLIRDGGSINHLQQPRSSSMSTRLSLFMRPPSPKLSDPATTISAPRPSFTPAISADDWSYKKKGRTSSTTTLISRHSVTEFTWIDSGNVTPVRRISEKPPSWDNHPTSSWLPEPNSLGPFSGDGDDSSVRSPPLVTETNNSAEEMLRCNRRCSDGHLVALKARMESFRPEDWPESDEDGHPNHTAAEPNPRDSPSVHSGTTDKDPPKTRVSIQEGEVFELSPSLVDAEPSSSSGMLSSIRKKSFQFGQAIGNVINGGYRNTDHIPRRESSAIRMRAILDRVSPARPNPNQDTPFYVAMTGAQPVRPIPIRPKPPKQACSEDGRDHKCVQHNGSDDY